MDDHEADSGLVCEEYSTTLLLEGSEESEPWETGEWWTTSRRNLDGDEAASVWAVDDLRDWYGTPELPSAADPPEMVLPDPNGLEWAAKNARRGELIDKDIDGELTEAERAEFAALDLLADAMLAMYSPFRTVDEKRKLNAQPQAEEEWGG